MDDSIFWISIVVYSAHILEEYNLNWKKWVFSITKNNIEWSDFLITNSIVVILGICFAMIGAKHLEISLMFTSLMFINAVFFHLLPTIIFRTFSPGLITSIILFIPLSVLIFINALSLPGFNYKSFIISITGGFVIMIYPIILQYYKRQLK